MTDVERLLREAFVEDADLAPQPPDPADIRDLAGRRRPLPRWTWPLVGAAAAAARVGGLAQGGALGTRPDRRPAADGPQPGGAPTLPPPTTTLVGGVPCPEFNYGVFPHLPKRVTTTTAFVCVTEERTDRAGTSVMALVLRRVTGGLGDVLSAYSVPDSPTIADDICPAVLLTRNVLVLRESNRWVYAREPVGRCGVPNEAAVKAFERLTSVEVASKAGTVVSTPLGRASGCPETVKDTLDLATADTGAAIPRGAPGPGTVVCAYEVPLHGSDPREGILTTAGRLSAADAAVVTGELAAARAGTCHVRAHTRFALVLGLPATPAPATTSVTTDGGSSPPSAGMPWTEVALDGCGIGIDERALDGSQALRDALTRTLRDHAVAPAATR